MHKIERIEKHRKFCKHGLSHCLDVARIAYILSHEKAMELKKDIIYSCALLHDLGRVEEYNSGIPHEVSSARLAGVILKECDYSRTEIEQIITAIRKHRNDIISKTDLERVISEADKISRQCMFCRVRRYCKWEEKEKNIEIEV